MTRFIFLAGGVMSGIGKGVAAASTARILQSKGFRVETIKIDPYLNVDAGTMNPLEHGEVFVTDDGIESDQDLGNYERFLNKNLSSDNYITSGQVYKSVIDRERALKYKGRCVEVVPDIPNEVISRIQKLGKSKKADFVIVEIGGTVGEYQNVIFLEAARMMKITYPQRVLFMLISYIPIPDNLGEMKTKPTQYAVRSLNMTGIQPDIILTRSKVALDDVRKKKISISCNVQLRNIISAPDVRSIYEVPINLEREHLSERILKAFELSPKKNNLQDWKRNTARIRKLSDEVRIGIVGKYFETGGFTLMDSYISVIESIKHASWALHKKPVIQWLSAKEYEERPSRLKELADFDGIIVPGGFGNRGIEGKLKAIRYCREHNIPYLGLCMGLQLSVIEFARNVCKIKDATSREFSAKTKRAVIDVLPEQKALLREKRYGGTMRLGGYECALVSDTRAESLYRKYQGYMPKRIREKRGRMYAFERHRHRYEVNNQFIPQLEKKGMKISGLHEGRNLVEVIEIPEHDFFVATQFHPEYVSKFLHPHPIYCGLIEAAIKKKK